MATLRSGGRGKGGRVKSQRLAIAISLAFPKARKKGSRGRAKALELVVAAPAAAGITSFKLQAGEGTILMKNPTPQQISLEAAPQ
jgi:uncharacterized protein DUF6496